jgi:glycosyltransferase involved in cell wall biosynthesis
MADEFIIDAGPMGGGISGAGRYAFEMVDELLALESEIPFRIIVPPARKHAWDNDDWAEYENVTLETADITGLGLKRHAYYARTRPSGRVHHSLSSYVPLCIDSDRTLVTVHDLKQFKLPESSGKLGWVKRTYTKRLIARSVRVADHVITVSENTKSDIVDVFGISPETVSVVPLGPGGGRMADPGDPPVSPPYVCFVGTVRPHKNVDMLIQSYQQYRRTGGSNVGLVVAGTTRSNYQTELEATIDDEYRNDIHFLGHVDDETVARLYAHASAFVFPSLYEGFGLPPLEAMGYGTPVIASNRASIPEVVGDAGEYFDPTSVDDLAVKLRAVLEDDSLRERLRNRGDERYEQFSWERTARETLEIYRQIWE